MSLEKILRAALNSHSKKKIGDLIAKALQVYVNKDNLTHAIENNIDLLTVALNHYSLGHSKVTPLFKLVLRMYWAEVEAYLLDAEKMRKILSKDPECAKILLTSRGISYLNRCCKTSYEKLYDLAWI